jgi:hypothetical protein
MDKATTMCVVAAMVFVQVMAAQAAAATSPKDDGGLDDGSSSLFAVAAGAPKIARGRRLQLGIPFVSDCYSSNYNGTCYLGSCASAAYWCIWPYCCPR